MCMRAHECAHVRSARPRTIAHVHASAQSPRSFTGGGGENSLPDVTDDYSFVAYRKFDGGVVWIDKLYIYSSTGVTRPRRQRDTTSRYTTAMLHTLERAFSEDGVT